MSDLERLAEHYGVGHEEASELLDVLAWVRQRHQTLLRGFPSDLPGTQADVFAWDSFDAEMLCAALDFEVSQPMLRRMRTRSDLLGPS